MFDFTLNCHTISVLFCVASNAQNRICELLHSIILRFILLISQLYYNTVNLVSVNHFWNAYLCFLVNCSLLVGLSEKDNLHEQAPHNICVMHKASESAAWGIYPSQSDDRQLRHRDDDLWFSFSKFLEHGDIVIQNCSNTWMKHTNKMDSISIYLCGKLLKHDQTTLCFPEKVVMRYSRYYDNAPSMRDSRSC